MKGKIAAGVLTAALAIAAGLVAHFEGTRYVAYQDAGGVWTICEGHTSGVKEGDTATPQQCEAWAEEDLRVAAESVTRCIHAPLTANQLAALIDASYNIGPGVVCGSTLQRLANAGQPPEVWCEQLPRWAYVGGRKSAGLFHRRTTERDLCLTP